MLKFDNWELAITGEPIGRQFDNLTRTITVVGALPEGWRWEMLVAVEDRMDIISMLPFDGGIETVLTRDQLCVSGYYTLQLRGTKGDQVCHTNQITAYVGRSLSGDSIWPEIPSEFTQLEQRVHHDAQLAQDGSAQVRSSMAVLMPAMEDTHQAAQAAVAAEQSAGTQAQAAAGHAEAAAKSAELAQQAAEKSGYMGFEIDDNGDLIYQRTANVSVNFALEEGRLVMYG